jgi:hypothetical protein
MKSFARVPVPKEDILYLTRCLFKQGVREEKGEQGMDPDYRIGRLEIRCRRLSYPWSEAQ